MRSEIASSVVAAVVLALAAQVRLTLPGTPVSATAQTFVLALVASFGGRRTALGAVALYAAAAAAGLPVLSGGRGGWAAVSGPSAGYLVGFALAAAAIPWCLTRWGRQRWLRVWAAVEVGSVCILTCGALGLIVRGLSVADAWSRGVGPFIPGDLVKSTTAATVLWLAARRARARADGAFARLDRIVPP